MKKSELRKIIKEEFKTLNETNKFKQAIISLKNKIKGNFGKKFVCARHIKSGDWFVLPADVFFGMPMTTFFSLFMKNFQKHVKRPKKFVMI